MEGASVISLCCFHLLFLVSLFYFNVRFLARDSHIKSFLLESWTCQALSLTWLLLLVKKLLVDSFSIPIVDFYFQPQFPHWFNQIFIWSLCVVLNQAKTLLKPFFSFPSHTIFPLFIYPILYVSTSCHFISLVLFPGQFIVIFSYLDFYFLLSFFVIFLTTREIATIMECFPSNYGDCS